MFIQHVKRLVGVPDFWEYKGLTRLTFDFR
jgi:hypothetical protein